VTLDLQKASVGTTVKVDVSLDNSSINTAVTGFVTAYNKLSSITQSLGKYGGATDGSGSGNGPLIGNSTLRQVSSQLRQDATNTVSSMTGDYNSLAMIGISISKDGVMSLDSTKLNAALSADFQSVSDVFTSSNGVATRTYDRLNYFLQSGGPFDTQQKSLNSQKSALDNRLLDVQDRQNNVQAMLLKQFTAMDVSVGTFNSTGTFLNGWIKNL
jgi:flagellar hook-associated protein 2